MAAIERAVARPDRARRHVRRSWSGLGAGLFAVLTAAMSPASAQPVAPATPDALHQALQLSPQQEPAWQAYHARASAANPAQDRRRAAAQMFPSLTAPQRLDLIAAEMRQELLDLDQQARALKAFYAILSPDQRSIFDAQTLPQGSPPGQPGH